jgi:mannose-6-phosphate isomerase-like protein (cupin superfamily)
MPVFQSGEGQAPAWCELSYFDIVRLGPGQSHRYGRKGPKEKLIVGEGKCALKAGDVEVVAGEHGQFDLQPGDPPYEVVRAQASTVLVRMAGRWGDEVGGSGIFMVTENGAFDNHYHDCDEYWIVFSGRGVAMSEGREYDVGPGDCVATGMGWHHDFPIVHEPVKAVFFETTIEGQKRAGHLWEQEHGPAEPKRDRV